MMLNTIAGTSVRLEKEDIPSKIEEVGVSSYHKPQQKELKPKDAMNAFHGCLVYMSKDFNETPDDFRDYV